MRSSGSIKLWLSLGVFVLALLVRLPHVSQSLWYDEMYTLVEYVQQPWQKVLAAKPGEYVPNNHVLHTILVKGVYSLGKHDIGDGPNEALLRLPAMLAGCLLPMALAWPLRRSAPIAALVVAIVASVHPWLIAFSDEARGYSLMLLLGVIATNLLPDGSRRWPIGYAIALSAAIYTVPIALFMVPAHALTIALRARESRAVPARSGATRPGSSPVFLFVPWLRGAAIAVALSILLYLPMARGMWQYYRKPYETTITYREFLDQLPRFALAGERLPRQMDPILPQMDAPGSSVYWALPVLVIVIGSVFAWSHEALRPTLVTLGVVSVLGVLLPLVSPAATEVRFVPWLCLWFILAVAAVLLSPPQRWARGLTIAGVVLLIGWMGLRDAVMLPNQPIREGIRRADELAPRGYRIVITYLGAREAAYLYGGDATQHEIDAAHDMPRFIDAEARALHETGRKPWLIILYEDLARRRNSDGEDGRGLWSHLIRNYRLVGRLPGRVSPVSIYTPREEANVAMAR